MRCGRAATTSAAPSQLFAAKSWVHKYPPYFYQNGIRKDTVSTTKPQKNPKKSSKLKIIFEPPTAEIPTPPMKQRARNSTLAAGNKLAPRSSNQYRIGPPFGPTEVITPIFDDKFVSCTPEISARIDRGFDFIDGGWVGYKRNYFTLVACFRFYNQPLDICHKRKFLYADFGKLVQIKAFKLSIRHTCLDQENFQTTLVQHTAKRDRGPQFEPPEYLAVPGELPAHEIMKELANIRNGPKISFYDSLFYILNEEREAAAKRKRGILSTYPKQGRIAMIGRYERIQFQSVPVGSKRFGAAFKGLTFLVVQLLGVNENGTEVVLANSTSVPLTVRGRSPLNYGTKSSKETKSEGTTDDAEAIGSNPEKKTEIPDSHNDEENKQSKGLDRQKGNQAFVREENKKYKALTQKRTQVFVKGNRQRKALARQKVNNAFARATSGTILQRNKALENQATSLFARATVKRKPQIRNLASLQPVVPQVICLSDSHTSSLSTSQITHRSQTKDCVLVPLLSCELSSEFESEESPSKRVRLPQRTLFDSEQNENPKKSLVVRLRIGQENCLKILAEELRSSWPYPIHEGFEFMSDGDFLNDSLAQRSKNSEKSDTASDPFFDDLAINCPLGCFPSFPVMNNLPVMNNDFFLNTSTPFVKRSLEYQTQVQDFALCKHGFKRTVKRAVTRTYGSEDLVSDNYDSSFLTLRNGLDEIKKNIRIPQMALSSLTQIDFSHINWDSLWEELLALEAVKLAHHTK